MRERVKKGQEGHPKPARVYRLDKHFWSLFQELGKAVREFNRRMKLQLSSSTVLFLHGQIPDSQKLFKVQDIFLSFGSVSDGLEKGWGGRDGEWQYGCEGGLEVGYHTIHLVYLTVQELCNECVLRIESCLKNTIVLEDSNIGEIGLWFLSYLRWGFIWQTSTSRIFKIICIDDVAFLFCVVVVVVFWPTFFL